MTGETRNHREIPDSQGLSLLVADVDTVLARAIGRTLSDGVAQVCLAESVQQALVALAERPFDALIVGFDDERGRTLLETQASRRLLPEILVHTRSLTSPAAEWVRQNALGEVLEKPAPVPVLLDWMGRIGSARAPLEGATSLGPTGAQRIIGDSSSAAALRELVRRVAGFSAMPVLIVGEEGTGKTLVARAIHEQASLDEPLLFVSCSQPSATPLDVELFGKDGEAGTPSSGVLERAGRGTVVLQGVGLLPRSVQPKLTRALETRRFSPVDSNREIALRARVIGTSRCPLRELDPPLRKDLCSCLSGYNIKVPPLREHPEDIGQLARHFIDEACREGGCPPVEVQESFLEGLHRGLWAKNIGQLRAVCLEAVRLSTNGRLVAEAIQDTLHGVSAPATDKGAAPDGQEVPCAPLVGVGRPFGSLDALERFVILGAYEESQGNLSQAARILGVARSTLRDRLRRYGIALSSRE